MDENEKYIEALREARNIGTEWAPLTPEESYVVIIPRERWEASPADEAKIKPNTLPVTCVCMTYISGLYSKDWSDLSSSKRSIKRMQSFHMAKGLPDIPYNFVVTSDFRIYEGRGWKIKPDIKQKPHSVIDIAFAQRSDLKSDRTLMFKMMETGLQLIHFGIQKEFILSGYITMKRHVDEAAIFEN